jgi:hypothetical protein
VSKERKKKGKVIVQVQRTVSGRQITSERKNRTKMQARRLEPTRVEYISSFPLQWPLQ